MYELQKIDLMWIKVTRRLQQLQQLLGESEELRAARHQVAETETTLHTLRSKQTDAELEGQTLAERIAGTEARLMSGSVRNPKELETLQQSLEALRRQRAMVEEAAVEALLQGDTVAEQLQTQQATLQTVETGWSGNQDELRQEEVKMKQNAHLLKRKREALVTNMDSKLLERYETMRKRKAGVAVASVQNGICSACHVAIPTGVVNNLRSESTGLVVCPSCGRFLTSS
jgi:predicted  nucleic acid-binding Zn-ribbon protein